MPQVPSRLRERGGALLQEAAERSRTSMRTRLERLRVAAEATRVLEETGNLSVTVVVGQVRSTAVDLLRGSGLTYEEAAELVREAAREAPAETEA